MTSALTLALTAALVIAAPSPRDQARTLYATGKALCDAGDALGCLAKRLEGHRLFPNARVIEAIVAHYEAQGDVRAAGAFLQETLAAGQPPDALEWCEARLSALQPRLEEVRQADAAAAAEATKKAEEARKAEDERRAREAEEARAAEEARKAQEALDAQATRRRLDDQRRKEEAADAQAVDDREAERTRWQLIGWAAAAVAAAGLTGGVLSALEARDEHDAAVACQTDFAAYGGACTLPDFERHRDAQAAATTTAFAAAGASAVSAIAAVWFLRWADLAGDAGAGGVVVRF